MGLKDTIKGNNGPITGILEEKKGEKSRKIISRNNG